MKRVFSGRQTHQLKRLAYAAESERRGENRACIVSCSTCDGRPVHYSLTIDAFIFIVQHCGHHTRLDWDYPIEAQILQVLTRQPDANASEIAKALPNDITEGRVRIRLEAMVDDGLVKQTRGGGGQGGQTTYRLANDDRP